ncbi:hypothetical protein Celaphus_00006968, partial [Cervus elaphus hippelaphus]
MRDAALGVCSAQARRQCFRWDFPGGRKLVYERIFSMCVDNRSVLPECFCSYVEASILKCNKFLSKTGISECLPRLTCMVRGIGDPLASVYARAYLCRVGMEVAPHLKESLNKNFFDFLLTFKQ